MKSKVVKEYVQLVTSSLADCSWLERGSFPTSHQAQRQAYPLTTPFFAIDWQALNDKGKIARTKKRKDCNVFTDVGV